MQFSHLHCHTQFSLLDGAADIKKLFKKAKEDNMPAVAITDHGNMFGVFEFVAEGNKQGIKPIVGCEFYVVEDRHIRQFTKDKKDVRHHQLLLAKDELGYKNLVKMCSLGFIEGMYGKYPRIDKELIVKYHKGLIATTCCIGAIIPKTIIRKGEAEAEKEFKWWLDLFGEDFYVELQRHEIRDQYIVNEVLIRFARKYNVKIIASNDSHYVDQEDWNAHDILLCINTGDKQSTPSAKDFDDDKGIPKGSRFAFFNDQFYFKNTSEMMKLFNDLPESLDNTNEIVDKIKALDLRKDILLPNFPIPDEFKTHTLSEMAGKKELTADVLNQWEYLKHLTFVGAKFKYGTITPEIEDRLNFELQTIRNMGFPGYFLIVADFIDAGRKMGVFIGPGRGSAAGSVVAYCTGITNIDPIKYDLLFERFLNPDRISLPDIDTDFDDEGRQKVIDYVVKKYGYNQVAQIVTYGTMAAKSAIKDVARVMDLPLADANMLAKLVPDKPTYNMTLNRIFTAPLEGEGSLTKKEGIAPEELDNVKKMRAIALGNDLQASVLQEARRLEGTVRNTGIHAAGIIIAPSDLTEIIPVSTSKDSDFLITQYQGKIIEDAGVIKMDFLGLRNLTIIKEALRLIKQNHNVDIVIDDIPLDDPKVFELFQRGETNAIFQFESDGMKKYMRDLIPDRFEHLIAMNALYRPGPIAYIPNFIRRKNGLEEVTYDLPELEEYLADTYGITVYQEQVMLLSQKLGGFTKGQADTLRKAMGKKQIETLNKMKGDFMKGGAEKGLDAKKLEKIWTDWEAFASYAFNKSHSTCYAFVAYQTAYLKAHYTAEYMSAVLTSSLGNIEKITFFMEECKAQGLKVLGPDINESDRQFNANKKHEIRFGLAGVKGSGDAAVEAIIEERNQNGPFKDIFDFMTRVNLRTVNKKTIESLAYAGGFDCFPEYHRAQYFATDANDNLTFIEKLIRYANKAQGGGVVDLFSHSGGGAEIAKPKAADIVAWDDLAKLRYEQEVVGFYISGHPLDTFRVELDNFCNCTVDKVMEIGENEKAPKYFGKEISVGGIVTSAQERMSRNGSLFMIFKIEDYRGSMEMLLGGEDYIRFKNYLQVGQFLYIKGKVQNRWKQEDQFEFKISQIQLLTEIRDKMCRKIRINLTLDQIDAQFIHLLNETFGNHPGACAVNMTVIDPETHLEVEMVSRGYRVAPSNELFKVLNGFHGVKFFLN
ncbi:DNA polymerase III subunit alpha [Dyadobacter fanqingshengii]|uniref:DNA polymerase III subunit alpha n=1 Tax=Dyadobacter fanqingshengii TaxID=2906443 RepID=A0A9X1T9Q9_9BACT|nr:DNA polymerase III subunit alpha [Dyadobacter fanqingshengii]MCF0040713.1 DNA polymerase III subunit alpha [Dyadobacter fanqingshengii]MCF2506178.1 DNA polymerase III subunit alpha [Dyadobacter fanqingshengii]USJ37550.1 DNA polymerase III subunit alpha [Dyadobacter fanqingshengii]